MKTLLFSYNDLPNELKEQNRFCLWKLVDNTKIPLDAKNGKNAKTNDSSTWCDFNTAISGLNKFNANGIGFMLGGGFFGIDIDNHNNDNIEDLKKEFITTLSSYTEYSQSGKGIHIICKGVLPSGRRRKGNIEMYDNVRFFALTGKKVEGTENYTLEERTLEIKELYAKYLGEEKEERQVYSVEDDSNRLLTNKEVIDKILSSKSSNLFSLLYYGNWEGVYQSQSDADIALCNILAFWCNKNKKQMDEIFRTSGLFRPKWNEKRGELTYSEITLNKAIQDCKNTYGNIIETNGYLYTPNGEEIEQNKNYSLNDTGNAERFIDTFGGEIKYNIDNGYWMFWNGKYWEEDKIEYIKKKADDLIKIMKKEAFEEEDLQKQKQLLKNINHLSSYSGKNAMIKEAQHIGKTPIRNVDFDKDPYLLNTQNGIIDLRNGKILPHNKNYLMSRITSCECDLSTQPTLWVKTINEIFDGDRDLIEFMFKSLGYSLTGLNKEQCLFELTGDGGNGKSLFLNCIYDILGSYTINMQIESILSKNINNGANASSDIARLNGVRLVRTNEPNEGSRFNEGLIKQMTGGDVITARFLYGKEFDFKPIFKLWIACNSKIIVRGTDKGIWRRMRVIDFTKTFDEKTADKELANKLISEYPAILGWCVKGAMRYLSKGLEMCESVRKSTETYKNEMDVLSQFIEENIDKDSFNKISAKNLYQKYKEWARFGGEYEMTQTKFGREMAKRFKKMNLGGINYYFGIKFKDETYEAR